ncbi:amino acid ABC transporter substrate-binding protein [Bordetella ansorpii]|uniref:Amino acid ABC transporter substrate-binding protein n=1 Tax=Bordetella ansorpii TaxID=288768 RepID=A0A157QAF9_9BORD|nr:transporter substrate-binding domain-containing protein [Bordetella ansorpii]SAI42873.1 amino acid ABC transporter substrate-binding protein [Bordetella ansorpii]
MNLTKLFGAVALVCSAIGTAQAQELTGTLKKIKDAGMVTMGVRESSPPFNYAIGGGQYTGYSYEIELKVLEALKQKLGMPDLKHRLLPFTSQNRIALIRNGTLDFECSSTTNNLERQQQVAFSTTIFAIGTRLMTNASSGIKDFTDLKGKTLVTVAGSTSEKLINTLNVEKQMGMHIIGVPENNQAFLTLQQGRAAAYMMDDAVLYGARSSAVDTKPWVIVGTPQSYEAYGCMMQKDDKPIKELIDGVITSMQKSGEMAKLYAKWFEQPIPPRNVSLDFPMSDAVKQTYANPNDKAFQ